jgi:hypothetical protein
MRYYTNDITKKITIYNEDFSVYKTINYPNNPIDKNIFDLEDGQGIRKIENDMTGISISMYDHFFNMDSKIEFVFFYRRYNLTEGGKAVVFVMNEDGEVMFTLEQERIDLFGYANNFEIYNETNNSNKIYQVGGIFPCNLCGSDKPSSISPNTGNNNPLKLNAIPNPNYGKATINYELPPNTKEGKIKVYNFNGLLLKEILVNDSHNQVELNTSDFKAGTYFYELETAGYASGGKKMMVVK